MDMGLLRQQEVALGLVVALLLGVMLGDCARAEDGPRPVLGVYAENPRYFALDGAPVFLASKSFGWTAISDGDFDYVRDIETMAAHGGNLLRLTLFWPGHGDEGGLLPWKRDAETGQYDLDVFEPAYFARLRDYLRVSAAHGAVVNLESFDHPAIKGGASRWPSHPMNPARNVNYGEEVFHTSSADRDFFWTLPALRDNPVALHYQEALVRKVLDETLDFEHVIYSLGNECPSPPEWNMYWTAFIKAHAAEGHGRAPLVTNMWRADLPDFDAFDAQDAQAPFRVRRAGAAGMWGAYQALEAWRAEHDRVKPVYDSGQMGGAPGAHILHQLWMSFVGGTAGMRYHRLAPVRPPESLGYAGDWEHPLYLEQLRWVRHLRDFIDGMEFWTMTPLWDAVGAGEGYGFGRAGEEYVYYLPRGGEIVTRGPAEAGRYVAYWYDPDSGAREASWEFEAAAAGEAVTFSAPGEADWVLHVRRVE